MPLIVQKAARLALLINGNPRLTIRRICIELSLSRSTAYRWLKALSSDMAFEIRNGVVYNSEKDGGGAIK